MKEAAGQQGSSERQEMTIKELKEHCVRQITEFERIKEIMPITPNGYKRYEEHKFILQLIKALEQQPSEDTVSREAVKSDLCELCGDKNSCPCVNGDCDDLNAINALPPVTPRSLNPEADREESKAYCAECDHIEMCSWYPHDGCEWLKTDRYNAGYNAAKREIALSGEYERAYERGKADAQPKMGRWISFGIQGEIDGQIVRAFTCSKCGAISIFRVSNGNIVNGGLCPNCGAKMQEVVNDTN